jgi:hypothetical protein
LIVLLWVLGLFPREKGPENFVDHPQTPSAEVKEKVELHIYSPCGLSWPELSLPIIQNNLKLGWKF